jgi:NitT/TauT family transport system ATP-binding protein
LDVDGLNKSFATIPKKGEVAWERVLQDITFDVRRGEIVSIVGLSGCGKTTLLRIIAGLLEADSGQVRIGGEVVNGPGRDRGVVFQHAALFPWRTTLKNVAFGLEAAGVPTSERLERARQAIELVGLSRYVDYYPRQLSGGMQQRVGLARAMAVDPEILLMDEPFSALDAQTREELQSELLELQERTGRTVLFVTHDLDEAVYLSDRILVLLPHPGRVSALIEVPIAKPRVSQDEVKAHVAFGQVRLRVSEEIRK